MLPLYQSLASTSSMEPSEQLHPARDGIEEVLGSTVC